MVAWVCNPTDTSPRPGESYRRVRAVTPIEREVPRMYQKEKEEIENPMELDLIPSLVSLRLFADPRWYRGSPYSIGARNVGLQIQHRGIVEGVDALDLNRVFLDRTYLT